MLTRTRHLIAVVAFAAAVAPRTAPAQATAPRPFTYSFHVGSAHPLGAMDSLVDANIHAAFDFTYRIGDRTPQKGFNAKLVAEINQFTAEPFVAFAHPRWTSLSVNLQAVTGCSATGLRCYIQAGPGIYWPKTGSSEMGFNVGVGFQVPVGAPFALEFGADWHQIQTKPATKFYTWHLGVLFH